MLFDSCYGGTVSIPQAVSTVATQKTVEQGQKAKGFNTASGKYCCNVGDKLMTIQQGVQGFNTASGKYCCNYILFQL